MRIKCALNVLSMRIFLRCWLHSNAHHFYFKMSVTPYFFDSVQIHPNASMEAGELPPTVRKAYGSGGLHPNHGKQCANQNCQRLLVTGNICAGIFCNRHECGHRGLAGQLPAKRKAEGAIMQKPAKRAGKMRAPLAKIVNSSDASSDLRSNDTESDDDDRPSKWRCGV